MNKSLLGFLLLIAVTWFTPTAHADGLVVDKVYHPYVLANEKEFEWRIMSSQTENKNRLGQRFGYGQSFAENKMLELYVIGERDRDDNFGVTGYELEMRWMLTEQGQYSADWGAIFEFEKHNGEDNFEATSGIAVEKEFGKLSATLNAFLIYEWGNSIENEFETEFRAKFRYRYMSVLQPSIELYLGEDFVGIGPGFMGTYRFEGQKQLKWEAGFISEISHSGKDHTLRFALEYEF
jgi:hypothetical protein